MQMDDIRFVQTCVEERLLHRGKGKDERRAFRFAASATSFKLIFGTIGTVVQFGNGLRVWFVMRLV